MSRLRSIALSAASRQSQTGRWWAALKRKVEPYGRFLAIAGRGFVDTIGRDIRQGIAADWQYAARQRRDRRFRAFLLGYPVVVGVFRWLTPAYAQFLNEAEQYVNGLPAFGNATELIGLVFGALRLMILLFIGYRGYRAIAAYREGEDYQSIVLGIVIVVVSLIGFDALAGFVTTTSISI